MQMRPEVARVRGAGSTDGTVSLRARRDPTAAAGEWAAWAYFPNTGQLRNQYVADVALGYPLCLSTCAPPAVEDAAGRARSA